MADQQIGHPLGFAAVSIGNGGTNPTNLNGSTGNPDAGFDDDDSDTIAALKSRLATIDATFYTTARMHTMTYNDLVFAVRTADNTTSIKQ